MKLSRTTPCHLFNINSPVWDGRKVGLHDKKIGLHNEINILYKNKAGERIYPNPMYISGDKARTYPTTQLKKYPIVLHWIPIADLEILERV